MRNGGGARGGGLRVRTRGTCGSGSRVAVGAAGVAGSSTAAASGAGYGTGRGGGSTSSAADGGARSDAVAASDNLASPALLIDELIELIFLRLPPEEPAHLFRAALVCKAWRRVLSDGGFLSRYREFHRTPPLLGYLHNSYNFPQFVPTSTASPFKTLGASWPRVLDCRHGRVLINLDYDPISKFTVWDPITRDRKDFVAPINGLYAKASSYNAAVLCFAQSGCDHLGCHGGPFRVVLVANHFLDDEGIVQASTYSSATDVWSATPASIVLRCSFELRPSLLIGDALYFVLKGGVGVLKYDLGNHVLAIIDAPRVPRAIATKADDGGLGFVAISRNNCIYLMSRQADGGWERHRDIELETLLPKSPVPWYHPHVVGYVEGTNTILVSTDTGLFTLELKSRQTKKIGETNDYCIIPYTSFYTPSYLNALEDIDLETSSIENPSLHSMRKICKQDCMLISCPSEPTGKDSL